MRAYLHRWPDQRCAVRQLDSRRRLASSIDDWGRFWTHNADVLELLRAYGQWQCRLPHFMAGAIGGRWVARQ